MHFNRHAWLFTISCYTFTADIIRERFYINPIRLEYPVARWPDWLRDGGGVTLMNIYSEMSNNWFLFKLKNGASKSHWWNCFSLPPKTETISLHRECMCRLLKMSKQPELKSIGCCHLAVFFPSGERNKAGTHIHSAGYTLAHAPHNPQTSLYFSGWVVMTTLKKLYCKQKSLSSTF